MVMAPTSFDEGAVIGIHPAVHCRYQDIWFDFSGASHRVTSSLFDNVIMRNIRVDVRPRNDGHEEAFNNRRLFAHLYSSSRPRESMTVVDPMRIENLTVRFHGGRQLSYQEIFTYNSELIVPPTEGVFGLTIEEIS